MLVLNNLSGGGGGTMGSKQTTKKGEEVGEKRHHWEATNSGYDDSQPVTFSTNDCLIRPGKNN